MAHNEQAGLLRRQISDIERLVKHFDTLREKVSDLVQKAPHDPASAERLVQLERTWKNDIQQKAEQMQQYMKEALRARAQYQQMKRQLKNGAAGVEDQGKAAMPPVSPAQKPRVKKTRCFA